MISEELQVREFHGDSLSEIGALAADKAVKLRSVMQEPACRNKRLQTGGRKVGAVKPKL